MKVISIFNQKGGVGKTTTTINLASYIALRGKKVLVIDLDPQGNATSGLGINKIEIKLSTYDFLLSNENSKQIIVNSDKVKKLSIIPSNIQLASAELEISNIDNREQLLKNRIDEIKSDYDFIFIDCPPSLGLLTVNSLTASDSVIIPMQTEYFALEGISQLIGTVNRVNKGLNKSLKVEGVVLTMFDPRRNLHLEVAQELKKHFAELVYKTSIPRNVRLAECPSFGLPIHLYDEKCKGAEAYDDLAKEFLKRNKS